MAVAGWPGYFAAGLLTDEAKRNCCLTNSVRRTAGMRIGSARRISGIAAAVLCVAAVGLASSPARAAKASPATLFAADAVPTTRAVDDSGPLEVGVRFTPAVTGKVTGIRFY